MTTTRIIGPINRVEGDLELKIEIAGNTVQHAWVNAPLFRGFEHMLLGRSPSDSLVYTPRICGICSVSQSIAAARALASAYKITPNPNGERALNLIHAVENLADHLTHFYLFFMPDFAREEYSGRSWHDEVVQRYKAGGTEKIDAVLKARAEWMHIMGILAGKWPHSLAIQPGGTTRTIQIAERIRILSIVRSFRAFLEKHTFGLPLEAIASIESASALNALIDQAPTSDFALFLRVAEGTRLKDLGRSYDRFMSFGAYPLENKNTLVAGIYDKGFNKLNVDAISEDISNSWVSLDKKSKSTHLFEHHTYPDLTKRGAYSLCKAPRLDGQAFEVGALARQLINRHPLIVDMVEKSGGNVLSRVVARLLELAIIVPKMEEWIGELKPNEAMNISFSKERDAIDEAQGLGLTEAARGSLGHWLSFKNGIVENYQIIAPTTWNFSPRDSEGQKGPLEYALEGTHLEIAGSQAVELQHIIRSFDPCMVCTVH